ncbi:MAG TPA: patatin-like phospholipase family protein [Bdellovibrionales bacterium]|nr:patatin-like phospholipase family protein [Bdellovibrionales bacterium]
MKLGDKRRIALVLSGGGVKAAAFHIGVCLALREKGFKFGGGGSARDRLEFENKSLTFTIYVGSSAGSVVAAFLAAGHSIDAIIEAFTRGVGIDALTRPGSKNSYLKPISYRDIFALNIGAASTARLLPRLFRKRLAVSGGLEALLKEAFKVNGVFSTRNIERYIRNHVLTENDFKKLGAELYIVATQLNHSRKVVFGPYDETVKQKEIKRANYAKVSEAVAASAALPPFFAPYGIANQSGKEIFYFDGEIRDTLSTHVAAERGADLVIASYSIQPYHYTPEMGSLHEYGMPLIFNQALYQVVQKKIESHIRHQQDVRGMIKAVQGYMRERKIDEEHITKLTDILITRTHFNPAVDYIYIHPRPQDYEFFFYDHFSLNPKVLSGIVRTGFKSAMNTLRAYNI